MTDIQFLKGVGPKRAEALAKVDVRTVQDLLHYYPRDYQDRRIGGALTIAGSVETVVFIGRVTRTMSVPAKSILIFKAFLENENGETLEATWFKKRPFYKFRYDPMAAIKKDFKPGLWMWVVGKREDKESFISNKIIVSEYYSAEDPSSLNHVDRLTPVYALTEGLSNKLFRNSMASALEHYLQDEKEILPAPLIKKRKLLGIKQAVKAVHFPGNMSELEAARRRLAYEEFLILAAGWGIKKKQNVVKKDYTYEIKKTLLTPFRKALGFDFTNAQKKVINEIFKDMVSDKPMTRLLQGDVGSGKTVAAVSAALLAAENGYQAAIMAPTEILAEQHFLTIKRYLADLGVNIRLLTSSNTKLQKEKIITELSEGKIDIIVGTHSLIEKNVKFKNLRLVVIDEQHRFGVAQRTALRQKAKYIDMLSMTATPIPRTLSLALYGDLDVSVIDELPPGRKPITTMQTGEHEAYSLIKNELEKGHQAYIVYPLIDESEKLSAKAVKEEFDKLTQVFGGYKLAMLHGKMSRKDKEAAMQGFLEKKTDILVATPVIEVGIDVRNATVMMINSAERFGLASLHQLRGRVGRGADNSFCILAHGRLGEVSRERLDIVCKTQDGFEIGSKDMELRGPGEILGTRQSGEFEFKAGDILKDQDILRHAAEDRDEILAKDPLLERHEHKLLRQKVLELYRDKWNLIDLS